MAEWLGRGLQNLLQRFESACRLESPATVRDFLIPPFSTFQNTAIHTCGQTPFLFP